MPDDNKLTTRYQVDLTNTREHLINIELTLLVAAGEDIQIRFPVWTPGSYLVREYSRNITSISANSGEDTVALVRLGKNAYQIPDNESDRTVNVRYQVFCRENSVRTNWLDEDYGFLVGAGTFFQVHSREAQPVHVALIAPQHWKSLATPLQKTSEPKIETTSTDYQFVASNFDELIDSPILGGNFPIHSFEVCGKQHYFANMGGEENWDYQTAIADMSCIVEHHQQFWQDCPYKPYWFINLCTESRGGLEHDDSTVLMSGRDVMLDRDDYVDWLGLVSHEFFHTWNVRRLRPKELMHYEYGREQHFEELWIAEGITSYFDDLALTHCGLCSENEFLTRWSKTIRVVQTAPGRELQSLADSSWDAWTKLYRQDAYSRNSQISYYSKGALLAWLLDIRMRKATQLKHTLHDAMRMLWQRYLKSGYTLHDFEKIIAELAGEELAKWLHAHVVSPMELELHEACEWLGLEFGCLPKPSSLQKFGCELKIENGSFKLSQILRGSAASEAGLQLDDELLGIDGFRFDSTRWKRLLREDAEERCVQLLVSRRGKLLQLQLAIPEHPIHDWELQCQSDQSKEQLENRQNWLGLHCVVPEDS